MPEWRGSRATIFAFAPAGMFFSLGLLSEVLAAFLVALVVWCSLRVRDHHGWLWSVATGLTFGLLLLCKPGFLFVLPLLPLWAWAVCGRRVHDWFRIAAIPVSIGLVILPWVVRNLLVMGALHSIWDGWRSITAVYEQSCGRW